MKQWVSFPAEPLCTARERHLWQGKIPQNLVQNRSCVMTVFKAINLLKRFIWNKLDTWVDTVLCCQLAAWAMRVDWWKQIAVVEETHSNFVWEVLLTSLLQSPAAWHTVQPCCNLSRELLFLTAEIPPPSLPVLPMRSVIPNRNTSTLMESDEYLSLTQQTSFSVLQLSTAWCSLQK